MWLFTYWNQLMDLLGKRYSYYLTRDTAAPNISYVNIMLTMCQFSMAQCKPLHLSGNLTMIILQMYEIITVEVGPGVEGYYVVGSIWQYIYKEAVF